MYDAMKKAPIYIKFLVLSMVGLGRPDLIRPVGGMFPTPALEVLEHPSEESLNCSRNSTR